VHPVSTGTCRFHPPESTGATKGQAGHYHRNPMVPSTQVGPRKREGWRRSQAHGGKARLPRSGMAMILRLDGAWRCIQCRSPDLSHTSNERSPRRSGRRSTRAESQGSRKKYRIPSRQKPDGQPRAALRGLLQGSTRRQITASPDATNTTRIRPTAQCHTATHFTNPDQSLDGGKRNFYGQHTGAGR
jgi:hypothetical protein